MKFKGQRSIVDDETEEEMEGSEFSTQAARIVVGYALTSKKRKSFLQPKFICLARVKGIDFVAIDLKRPLSEQGPFNVILHKLTSKEWPQVIEEYQQIHPEVIVVDSPDAIRYVSNRQTMLEVVGDLKLPDCYGKVCVPKQLVISEDFNSVAAEVSKAGLRAPLVVKPLLVDGSAKSHELFLAYDHFSLLELPVPVVLQEFVNHGGVLFKVFIVGESINVVKRFSLPDITKSDISKVSGMFRFPRVSCASASADGADLDPSVSELPPQPLLEMLAREVHHRMGLRLFNIDIIRQYGTKDVYYVIDINYFPGYAKMPEYERVFTDFILNLVKSKL